MGVDRSIPEDKLKEFTETVFSYTDSELSKFNKLFKNWASDLGLDVHLRTGSGITEIVTIITTEWMPLSIAFSDYTALSSNVLEAIREKAHEAGESIKEKIKASNPLKGAQKRFCITTGQFTQLIRIYQQVESGEISHGVAQDEVVRMFERAGELISKEFTERLRTFFKSITIKPRPRLEKTKKPKTPPPQKPKFNHGGIMERDPGKKDPTSRFW